MQTKKVGSPKRRDRYRRIVVDYSEARFHQNEEILKILREMLKILKKKNT